MDGTIHFWTDVLPASNDREAAEGTLLGDPDRTRSFPVKLSGKMKTEKESGHTGVKRLLKNMRFDIMGNSWYIIFPRR